MKDETQPDLGPTIRIMENASLEARIEILEEQLQRLTMLAMALSIVLYYTISKMVFRDELPVKGA